MQSLIQQPYRRRGGALKVLLIIFVVIALICGGVVTYLCLNYRSIMVSALLPTAKQVISDSHLPQEQKSRLTTVLDRVGRDYQEKKISNDQMMRIGQELTQGSFFVLLQVELVRSIYHQKVQAVAEEAAAADLAFDQYERGIVEEQIKSDQAEKALGLVSKVGQNQKQVLDDNATPEQLKAFVERIAKEANEAGIPAEPYKTDFAGYLEDAVGNVLGESPPTKSAESIPATSAAP